MMPKPTKPVVQTLLMTLDHYENTLLGGGMSDHSQVLLLLSEARDWLYNQPVFDDATESLEKQIVRLSREAFSIQNERNDLGDKYIETIEKLSDAKWRLKEQQDDNANHTDKGLEPFT